MCIYGVVSSLKVDVTNLRAQSLKSVLGCCGFIHSLSPICDLTAFKSHCTVYIYGVVSSSKVVVTNLRAQSLKIVLGCCGFIHSLSPTCDFTAFKSHVYCVYIWCSVFIEGRRYKLACPVSQECARLLRVYPLIVSNMRLHCF